MNRRNTVQKQIVLKAVYELANHPTANEVYQKIVLTHPNISKATVYRNLNTLASQGDLRRISVADAADRFDHTKLLHYHVRCTHCGNFMDVCLSNLPDINSQVEKETGFALNRDIVFYGICPNCQRSQQ